MIDLPGKAVPEAIKETRKLVQVFADITACLVSDTAALNLTGLLADRMRYYRAGNMLKFQDKFRKKIESMGYSPEEYAKLSKHIPIKHLVPLFEAAGLEEDDNLQTLWANMLANATDPNGTIDLNRKYISILKELEPFEVVVLDAMSNKVTQENVSLEGYHFERDIVAQYMTVSVEDMDVAFLSLLRQQCVSVAKLLNITRVRNETGTYDTADIGARCVTVSRIGYRLWQLTRPPNAK